MSSERPLSLEAKDAQSIAHDAYLFGLPLVEHYRLFARDFDPVSSGAHPPNQFLNFDQLFTSADREVVSPNNDTLYSETILDLRAEPVVIQTPDMGKRYFSIQLVDITTNNLPYISTRTTGDRPATVVIVGPDWDGVLRGRAARAKVIRSPSQFVLALGRTQVDGVADLPVARALQRQLRVVPLSLFEGRAAPPASPTVAWLPYFDAKTDDSLRAFEYVNFMMQWHRFKAEERPFLARIARIGVSPGAKFEPGKFSVETKQAMLKGVQEARQEILSGKGGGVLRQGWQLPNPKVGNYGDDYLLRAQVAWSYLYANSPAEAVYLLAQEDGAGRPLDGNKATYTLRFRADQLPTARYFWSITMYDAQSHFLVANSLGRYSINGNGNSNSRSSSLERNADGTTTIYLQHNVPPAKSNWLPAPDGPFYVILRIYGPTETVSQKEYVPPPIERKERAVSHSASPQPM